MPADATTVVRLYATPDQIRVIRCKARYIGLFAGRRWGKTIGVIVPRMLTLCLSRPGFRYAYIAANTYKLAKHVWSTICAHARPLIRKRPGQPVPQIEFWNGSRIDFYSYNKPAGIRGHGYNEISFDEIQEAARLDPDTWWAIIRPLISDYRGNILVAGQFRGKNWYWKEFCDRGDKNSPDYLANHESFRFPASTGLCYQDAKGRQELEDAKRQIPKAVFAQEYDVEPLANQACVFDPADVEAAVEPDETKPAYRRVPNAPAQDKFYFLGHDLGMLADHGATVVIECEKGYDALRKQNTFMRPRVVHAQRWPKGVKHEYQAMQVRQLASKWRASVAIDATGGGTGGRAPAAENLRFYRDLIPDMWPVIMSQETKGAMVMHATTLFERKLLRIPAEFGHLIEEIQRYEYEYRGGAYRYGRAHVADDILTAMMLALWAAYAGRSRG